MFIRPQKQRIQLYIYRAPWCAAAFGQVRSSFQNTSAILVRTKKIITQLLIYTNKALTERVYNVENIINLSNVVRNVIFFISRLR